MTKARYVCANCGFIGTPEAQSSGCGLTIVLWGVGLFFMLLFAPLGVIVLLCALAYTIYSIVRNPPSNPCPKCKAPNMLPEDTPRGQELISKGATTENHK